MRFDPSALEDRNQDAHEQNYIDMVLNKTKQYKDVLSWEEWIQKISPQIVDVKNNEELLKVFTQEVNIYIDDIIKESLGNIDEYNKYTIATSTADQIRREYLDKILFPKWEITGNKKDLIQKIHNDLTTVLMVNLMKTYEDEISISLANYNNLNLVTDREIGILSGEERNNNFDQARKEAFKGVSIHNSDLEKLKNIVKEEYNIR